MKEDRALEAVRISVTTGLIHTELDFAVQAISGCVGDRNAQVGQDIGEMILE